MKFWSLAIKTICNKKVQNSVFVSAALQGTVVLYVGGRVLWVKILKCNFLVSLAPSGLERCGNVDFTTPKAQKVGKIALSNWLICPIYSANLNIAQTFKRHGTPHPGIIFNVFLNKLKPIWTFLASDELPKRGSVRQHTHF